MEREGEPCGLPVAVADGSLGPTSSRRRPPIDAQAAARTVVSILHEDWWAEPDIVIRSIETAPAV